MKADEIVAQQRLQYVETPRHLDENIGRGKGDVEEKPHRAMRAHFSQFRGDVNEMVIVHPDVVSAAGMCKYMFREFSVDRIL